MAEVRLATADEVRSVYTELYAPYLNELSRYPEFGKGMSEYTMRYFVQNGSMQLRVIEEDGRYIGFVLTEMVYAARSDLPEDMLYIVEMYVDREYRGRGAGKKAFSDILYSTDTPIFLYVIRGNTEARAFWKKMIREYDLRLRIPPDGIITYGKGLMPLVFEKPDSRSNAL